MGRTSDKMDLMSKILITKGLVTYKKNNSNNTIKLNKQDL